MAFLRSMIAQDEAEGNRNSDRALLGEKCLRLVCEALRAIIPDLDTEYTVTPKVVKPRKDGTLPPSCWRGKAEVRRVEKRGDQPDTDVGASFLGGMAIEWPSQLWEDPEKAICHMLHGVLHQHLDKQDPNHGHGKKYQRLAEKIGLEGGAANPTATKKLADTISSAVMAVGGPEAFPRGKGGIAPSKPRMKQSQMKIKCANDCGYPIFRGALKSVPRHQWPDKIGRCWKCGSAIVVEGYNDSTPYDATGAAKSTT
jgi:hypothetical protein